MNIFTFIPKPLLNTLLALFVFLVVVDTLPQAPAALHRAIQPTLCRLGINQGVWNLFAPDPDRTNTRLRAEITYRDGEQRVWHATDWSKASAWEKWVRHRHFEWQDHIINHKHIHVFEPWCRWIAQEARQDFPEADRGAEVKVIYQEAMIPHAEQRPWNSFRQGSAFDEGWVLTIEKLE
jgi:hypothetical protein